jgi:hypothetical protein
VYVQHVLWRALHVRAYYIGRSSRFPYDSSISKISVDVSSDVLETKGRIEDAQPLRGFESSRGPDWRNDVHLLNTLAVFGNQFSYSQDGEVPTNRSCPTARGLLPDPQTAKFERERLPCSCEVSVRRMQEPLPVGRSKRCWRSVSGNTNRSRERDGEGEIGRDGHSGKQHVGIP